MNKTEIEVGKLYIDKYHPDYIFLCLDKYIDDRFIDLSCSLLFLPKNKKIVYSIHWCEKNLFILKDYED